MPLWIWLAALITVAALPLAWWSVASTRSTTDRARTNLSVGLAGFTDLRSAVLNQPAHERVVRPAVASLAARARRITPGGVVDALERRINLAGMGERWPIERALAMKLVGFVVGGVFGLLIFLANPTFLGLVLFALIAGIGYFGPDIWMARLADDRQREIERCLADALDQITVCVEAGISFEGAVARTAEGSGPLAQELNRLLQDIQIGMPRAQALQQLLQRTDVPDLRSFVNAFTSAERYGVPIAQVLRSQSQELRDKRRQRAEERAGKVPVKLTLPLVLCILPALFIVVIGPGVIRISHAFGF